MSGKKVRLCFVGNMLGRHKGFVTTQGLIAADLFAAEGFDVICVSSKINRAARFGDITSTLWREQKNIDVVVLEIYSGKSFLIADTVSRLCKAFKLPLVMVLHGGNLPEFAAKYPYWIENVLRRADFLVAPSKFLASKIGGNSFEILVIPNILNLEIYPFREREKIKPRLIWMRSFHAAYNPEMAIKVLAALRETVPEATLTMAGKDKGLESKLVEMTGKMGLSDAIKFVGFLDEKRKMQEFSKADIYINTNRIDNMPVSILEACAMGLPVVATDVGGLPYLISDGENGLLVSENDVDAMVKAVKKLIDDSLLTNKISRNGRCLAERSSWKAVCPQWEKLFLQLTGKKEEPKSDNSRISKKQVNYVRNNLQSHS